MPALIRTLAQIAQCAYITLLPQTGGKTLEALIDPVSFNPLYQLWNSHVQDEKVAYSLK